MLRTRHARRRKSQRSNSSRLCWTTCKKPGQPCCLRQSTKPIGGQNWCCFGMRLVLLAAWPGTRSGRSDCPEDEQVYLDLSFFDELQRRFGAPGEFAQAYVIAHEIGHHVQKILGIEPKVQRLRQTNPGASNQLSVLLELQADCLAGIWAHSTKERKIIDASDVRSALGAAAAVGDDRLQRMSRGQVNPESFTHGSSAQRQQWFESGLNSGRLSSCNTFGQGRSRATDGY